MGGKTEEIKVIISADSGKLTRELTSAEKAVLKAKGIIQSASGGIQGSSKAWASYRNTAVSEMNKAMEGVRKAQEKIRQIRAQIQTTTTPDADMQPYIQASRQMGANDSDIQAMIAEMQRPNPALQAQYDAAAAELDRYKKAAQEAGQSVEYLNQKVEESSRSETAQVQSAKDAAARAKEQAKAARDGAASHSEFGRASKASGSGLWRFARTAGFALLGVASLYAGLRRLISAMIETAKSDSSMSSSLGQVKGNLQIAFQTVYQAALPALQALASSLATVTGYLAQFLGMLFGVSWGSASKGAQDYAKSVGGAGAAAKAAAQNMMAFDELNVMQTEDNSAGGGGGAGAITPIYKEQAMSQWMTGLVEWFLPIKEALSGLWTSIQEFVTGVAEQLNTQALFDLRDGIVAVIDAFNDLFENKAVQALVAGVLNIAILSVGTALSIAARIIEIMVSLLNGNGSGALASFLLGVIDAVAFVKDLGLEIENTLVTMSQSIALASATGRGDVEAVQRIMKGMENTKTEYEMRVQINAGDKQEMVDTINNLLGTSQTATDKIKEATASLDENSAKLETYKKDATELSSATAEAVTASTDAITEALANTPTTDAANQLGVDLMTAFSVSITENQGLVTEAFSNVSTIIAESLNGMIGNALEVGREGLRTKFTLYGTDCGVYFVDAVEAAILTFTSGVAYATEELMSDAKIALTAMGTGVGSAFDGAKATVKSAVDDVKQYLDSIPKAVTITVTVNFKPGSVLKFAGGGIIQMARGGIVQAATGGLYNGGQLIQAREAGPELIGNLGGGKTAIMNNDQIVESVSNGVYKAMVEALGTMQGNDGGDTVLYLDGREVARATRKAARSIGYQISGNPSFAR